METQRPSVLKKSKKKVSKPAAEAEQTVEVYDLTAETAPDDIDNKVQGIIANYTYYPTRQAAKELKKDNPELKPLIIQVSGGQRRLVNECLSPWQRFMDWTRQGNIKGTAFDIAKGAVIVVAAAAASAFVPNPFKGE